MKPQAIELLKKIYGYNEFKPNQFEIIEALVNKQNCIALFPTGYGKSILFIISSLLMDGMSIVVSPLISLMNDQLKDLNKKDVKAVVLHSNLDKKTLLSYYNLIVKNKVNLIYVSPERLNDNYFKSIILKIKISMVVVDEAHTILWGDIFRKSFLKIGEFIVSLPEKPVILAVTATATANTIDKIKEVLCDKDFRVYQTSIIRSNIIYKVINTKDKKQFLSDYFNRYKDDKIIIYSLTKKNVDYLSDYFNKYNVCKYHGGLSASIKEENQEKFSVGKSNIIFCTNAFGMGINISDIRHVIHYEIPASIEDLVQQSGRAGRDGIISYSTILFNFSDVKIIQGFNSKLRYDIKRREKKKLDKIIDFCLTKRCRNQYIASYFGENKGKCECLCDNCLNNT